MESEEFTDAELIEATKTFYSNCFGQAEVLARISNDCISELELKAAIEDDHIAEFIAHQANQIKQAQKKAMHQKSKV